MNDIFDRILPASVRRLPARSWLILGVFLLAWRLDYAPFWNPDEGRYAAASLEMAHPFAGASDWIVPHLDTIPRINKPPLVYWLGALSFKIFGVGEFAGRLGPALAAIGVMFLLWLLGRAMFDETSGICGSLVWVTSIFSFSMARFLNTDMLLAASITLALGGIWLAIEGKPDAAAKTARFVPYLTGGIGLGLALLAKGPVGMAFPLLIVFVYLCAAGRWSRVSWAGVGLAFIVAITIAAPWYWAIEKQRPGFLHQFIIDENFSRLSGKKGFHNAQPIYFYIPVIFGGLMPWTAFLIGAFRKRRGDGDSATWRARLFLWLWAILLIGFFSLSKTKLISYVLPAFPALALLIGEGIRFLQRKESETSLSRRVILVVSVALNALLLTAVTWYLLSGRSLPGSEALPYLLIIGFILICGSVCAVYYSKRNIWRWFTGQCLMASALFVAILALAGPIARYEDASLMIEAVRPYVHQGDTFALYRTFQPTAIYYLGRAVPVVEYSNNSGLDESHPNFKKLYMDDRALKKLLETSPHWFLLAKRDNPEALANFGKVFVIARDKGHMIVSNQPPPHGLLFDFVPPSKRSKTVPKT